MSPESWRRVEELFHLALECPPERRSAFLDEACAGDDALRLEVASLLSNPDERESFLETPAARLAAGELIRQSGESPIGQIIGAYQVVEEIAQGGMGTVYRAVRADDQYQQQVAIKLIKRGMDTDWIVRHFRAERQILSGLDHPNICRLLDGGSTEDGRPYFVMEYIEGVALLDYCDGHKLTLRERLKLFRAVCSAVQYAHQRLVVHRDIKPGNILVTEEGVPKLLDFGLATILSASPAEPTMTIERMLTPNYASPEQVRGETVTTASDIYSLGVVLYELLSGHRPHRIATGTPLEVSRAICETEPDKPSVAIARVEVVVGADGESSEITPQSVSAARKAKPEKLRRQLAGDVDNIVLKALRKEPERRYASAEQLSEDICRYMDGLPVTARKDTLAYRGVKFVRRHRAGVAAAALVVVSLTVGLLASLWQAQVARRRFQDLRKLANAVVFEFHDAIRDLPGSTPARLLLVKRALEYLDSLAREAQGNLELQRELAAAYEKMGEVQGGWGKANLGEPAGALISYRKALAIRQAVAATSPDNTELRRELAGAYSKTGVVLESMNATASALDSYRHALAMREALAAAEPGSVRSRRDLAISYHDVASALAQAGDSEQALALRRKALPLFESVMQSNPKDLTDRRNVALAHKKLGALLFYQDLPQALKHYQDAARIEEALCADHQPNADLRLDLSFTYSDIGLIQGKSGNKAAGLENYRKALGIREELAAADPQNRRARAALASVCYRMGHLQAELGDTAGALRSTRRALILAQAEADAPGSTSEHRVQLAAAYASLGYVHRQIATRRGAAAEEQFENWRAARRFYQQAAGIYTVLKTGGRLSAYYAVEVESARKGLAESEAALAKLQAR